MTCHEIRVCYSVVCSMPNVHNIKIEQGEHFSHQRYKKKDSQKKARKVSKHVSSRLVETASITEMVSNEKSRSE